MSTRSINESSEKLSLSLGVPKVNVHACKIAEFCKRWRVVELGVFGSIVRDDFGPDSDIDFIFRVDSAFEYTLDDLIGMEQELERMCYRRIELVDWERIEESANHLRKDLILRSVEVIYARY